jgi:hypothetical protein
LKFVKSVICRHCHEPFAPIPTKPGYVDECAPCLHERTRPAKLVTTETDKKLAQLRVELTKKKLFSEDVVEAVVAAVRDLWTGPATQ